MDDAGLDPSDTPDDTPDNVVPISRKVEIPDLFADVDDEAERMADADGGAVPLKAYRPKPGGSFIMAGMIGLANALGMEDFRDEIEIAIPFENDQDGLEFDFGKLPPL